MGYARIDTDQRSHTASAVVGTVTQTRPDLLPQALATLRAAERAPLATKLADVTRRLNDLLNNEPPRCSNCHLLGITPSVDVGTASGMGTDTAAGSPALQTALQPAGAAATAAPDALDAPASKSQAASTNSAWASWYAAVQRLAAEQASLQQRITAVDTKAYQTTVPLAANASALHQPLLHTFDRSKATQELKDGVAVTAAFGKAAFKAVGDAAATRTKAKEIACKDGTTSPACTAATAAAAGWEEGGNYKKILHGIVGAISGGQAGALAALTAETAGPAIGRAIIAAGVAAGTPAYDALMLAAKTAVGSGLGGTTGAAAAFNADANNRQLHLQEIRWNLAHARTLALSLSLQLGRTVTEGEALIWLHLAAESNVDAAMQRSANLIRGAGFSETAQLFDRAKEYIAIHSRGVNFWDGAQLVPLFGSENRINPLMYSEQRNILEYREYMWNVAGLNLRPEAPTSVEIELYNRRKTEDINQRVKSLAEGGLLSVLTAGKIWGGLALGIHHNIESAENKTAGQRSTLQKTGGS